MHALRRAPVHFDHLGRTGLTDYCGLLNQYKGDILAKFGGGTVDIDDGARMTWMRQPHYYRS